MTKTTIGLIIVLMLVVLAAVAAVRPRSGDDPIAFTAKAGDEFELYVSNTSDTTLVVNHITVITSSGAITTPKAIRVTNGSLFVRAPIAWRAGEDATVLVGCTFGKVNFVRQVTRFL